MEEHVYELLHVHVSIQWRDSLCVTVLFLSQLSVYQELEPITRLPQSHLTSVF